MNSNLGSIVSAKSIINKIEREKELGTYKPTERIKMKKHRSKKWKNGKK